MVYKLTENAVVRRVKNYLQSQGFTNISTKNTRQHGIDIVATAPNGFTIIYVEAKGEKSSKQETNRYKEGFNIGQKKDHLGKQLLWASQMLVRQSGHHARIAIALPNDKKNRELIDEIEPVLKRLRITCLLAEKSGNIVIKGRAL